MTARDGGFSARPSRSDRLQRAEHDEPDAVETARDATKSGDAMESSDAMEVESEPTLDDTAEVVEHDLEDLARERDDLRQLAQRVQADFENYRKRVLREQTSVVERATEGLVEALLPVLDSFELALGTLEDADEKVRKGVELVYAELVGVLEKAGLERIETDGKPFDPNVHEAVLQDEGDGDPVVGETMRTGYRVKGRVLRPAMVKVTR